MIDVATALDAYAKRLHHLKGNAVERLKGLVAYAKVPEACIGCRVRNLKLLVASRNFYAHYSDVLYGFTAEDVQSELLETIRRGSALMQACLLRDLGFEPSATKDLLDRHFANWPIPS